MCVFLAINNITDMRVGSFNTIKISVIHVSISQQVTVTALGRHLIHGKVKVTIWRVRVTVRVMWVTKWYLAMNYLPILDSFLVILC